MKSILGLFAALLLVGCTSLQTMSLTQVPAERNEPISASKEEILFLGIATNNDFADDLTEELRGMCANGKIQGILTKYEHTLYFIFLKRKITASGYCVREQSEVI